MHKVHLRSLQFVAVLAAGLFTAGRASADINYVTDGSFENPAYAANSLNEVTGQTINGWFGSAIPFNSPRTHEYFINGLIQDTLGRDIGITPFGDQYLGLNAIANNGFQSIESQAVSGLTIGQTYLLTIYIANLDGAPDPNILLTVEDNPDGFGDPIASSTFTAPAGGPYGTGFINFVPETLLFTATTDTIDLNINNQSRTGIMGIDNVSLVAVPEPASTAAVVLGAAALVGVARRRRRAS